MGETEFIAFTGASEISLFKRNSEGYLSATILANGVAQFQAVKGPSGDVAVAVLKFKTWEAPAPLMVLDLAGTQKYPTIYVNDVDAEPLEAALTPSGRFMVGVRCRSQAAGSTFRVYEPFVGQDFLEIPLVDKIWSVPRPRWLNGRMEFPLLALMGADDLKIVDPFQSLMPIAKIRVGFGVESFSEDGRFFSLFERERGTVSLFSLESSAGR